MVRAVYSALLVDWRLMWCGGFGLVVGVGGEAPERLCVVLAFLGEEPGGCRFGRRCW